VYAAYSGVNIVVALLWLWIIDGTELTAWYLAGAAVSLLGMGIIVWADGARKASVDGNRDGFF
jgi:small multidrug resistance family-3 protein